MEKQIRTTLILRNDTNANWAASSLVLKKGEVGFDTDLHIFKVGDGTKTWSQIETHFVDFAAVEKAIEDGHYKLSDGECSWYFIASWLELLSQHYVETFDEE